MSSGEIAVSPSARLDAWLPDAPFCDSITLASRAPADGVMRAAWEVTPREMPLATALGTLRYLPGRLTGRGPEQLALDDSFLRAVLAGGTIVLEEAPHEVVLGMIGRLHRLRDQEPVVLRSPDEFRAFAAADHEKLAMSLRAIAMSDGGSVLVLEHRTTPLDAAAQRRFARYWRVIRPGGALVTRQLLRAIARRAEREAGVETAPHEDHIATSVRF
jgi:hypothetical protein